MNDPADSSRWELLRDVLRFQLKLLADALRDLLLSPISLIVAFAGIILPGDNPRRYFDQLLRLGRRSERWINLFGAFRDPVGLDEWARRVEARIVEQYERGGMTASAKNAIDRTLDSVQHSIGTIQRSATDGLKKIGPPPPPDEDGSAKSE